MLDADANEQAAIVLHQLRPLAADLIGPTGAPAGADRELRDRARRVDARHAEPDHRVPAATTSTGCSARLDARTTSYYDQPRRIPRSRAGRRSPARAPLLVYPEGVGAPRHRGRGPLDPRAGAGRQRTRHGHPLKVVWQVLATPAVPLEPRTGSRTGPSTPPTTAHTRWEAGQEAQRRPARCSGPRAADADDDARPLPRLARGPVPRAREPALPGRGPHRRRPPSRPRPSSGRARTARVVFPIESPRAARS